MHGVREHSSSSCSGERWPSNPASRTVLEVLADRLVDLRHRVPLVREAALRAALAAGGVVDLLPSTVIKLGPSDTLDLGLAGNTVVNCSTCAGATRPTLRWDAIDTHLSRPLAEK